MFYQRLPPTIQCNLFRAKSKLSLEELATLADDFMTSVSVVHPTIAKLTEKSEMYTLAELVSKLALQVSALQERVNNFHRRSQSPRYHRNRSRSTSRGRPKQTPGFCFYHYRFGQDAKECTQPCTFLPAPLNEMSGR
ncbi:uncharacterized protein LOC143018946 [Oratosquilla oratoria]|uniref:uncharacterized protein LOC143018946 n=1 Tax=Oratosquilla oratoria TaxID=337810 RepID=UPI003F760788